MKSALPTVAVVSRLQSSVTLHCICSLQSQLWQGSVDGLALSERVAAEPAEAKHNRRTRRQRSQRPDRLGQLINDRLYVEPADFIDRPFAPCRDEVGAEVALDIFSAALLAHFGGEPVIGDSCAMLPLGSFGLDHGRIHALRDRLFCSPAVRRASSRLMAP